MRLIYNVHQPGTSRRVVIFKSWKYQFSRMKNTNRPDAITQSACRWLLSGGEPGAYAGPEPGPGHDLAPLLARELGRNDISLLGNAIWFRREQIIRKVLERLSAEGIEVWAVKGFDLARSVYPFPGGRPMCDADLFIEERNRLEIFSIFHQSGWSKGSPGDGIFTSGIVSEMKLFKHDIMAELHTHIFYFPATFPGRLPADLFENGRNLEPGLKGFAWHNALLLVLLHMLTNALYRPVWWVDVSLLCRKVTEDGSWDKFAQNASSTKLGHAIAETLAIARDMLNAPVPEAVIGTLGKSDACREHVLEILKSRRKAPTLLNLRYLAGWRKASWLAALFWLFITGRHPLRRA
jgi:hypothetical protein